MFNPGEDRGMAMWHRDFDFIQSLDWLISPVHRHDFGNGYGLGYAASVSKVQARFGGGNEVFFLRLKQNIKSKKARPGCDEKPPFHLCKAVSKVNVSDL